MGTRGLILFLLLSGLATAGPVEDAADAVLAAVKAGEDLKPLASRDVPGPWLVADELCARGEHDAAEAFAKAVPRQTVGRLLEYVARQRAEPTATAARRVLRESGGAVDAAGPAASLEILDGVAHQVDDVTRVRLQYSRGLRLRILRRHKESARAFRTSADAAERLGWIALDQVALDQCGRSCQDGSDFRGGPSWRGREHSGFLSCAGARV